jgi:VWFA-related protein
VAVTWLGCGASSLFGQQSPSPDSSEENVPIIRVSSNFVLVDALVENKRTGALLGGLEAGDFQVAENGVPQDLTYFSRDQLPLSIVFLFDMTDTVRPVLKQLAQGASLILSHLKPQDEVSVMVFSSHTETVQGFTTRRVSTEAAIEQASDRKTKDGTFIDEDMYEAIDQAIQSTAPQGRRVLVWLTDGTSNFENSFTQKTIGSGAPSHLHSKQEATDKLLHSGVVVAALIQRSTETDALAAAMTTHPTPLSAGARFGDIERYADLTGGPLLNSSKTSVTARLADLLDDLRGRYTLGYKPQTSVSDGAFCKLQVTLTPQTYVKHPEWKKSEIVVRAQSGYYR